MRKNSQKGFTLLEIIIATTVLGVITIAMVPSFKAFATARQLAYEAEQTRINQKIANAIYADASNKVGIDSAKLTPPCNNTTNKVFYSALNSTLCTTTHTSGYRARFIDEGLTESLVQSDGSGKENIRMYQRATVSDAVEIPFLSSENRALITSYDLGVVYLTNCGKNQACNQTATITSLPRSQPIQPSETSDTTGAARLLSTNYQTWVPGSRDIGVTFISTLPLQKELAKKTENKILFIRDALIRYTESLKAANPTSSANFYPQPSNPSERLPVTDPSTNDRCREGWYILDEARYDILALIGLGIPGSNFEMGRSEWGGSIEYCRDYDPSLSSPYGTAPHFAALRIHKDLTSGGPPDALIPQNNILISF